MSTDSVAQPGTTKPIRWHRHRWSIWGEPFWVSFALFGGGEYRQKRSCSVCGLVRNKRVKQS